MSTTGLQSWATDLKDVGAIYPFQGYEGLMVAIGVILWLVWHVWQIRHEKEVYRSKIERFGDSGTVKGAINGD